MTLQAFVDESRRGGSYLLAVALVDPAELARLRRLLRSLLSGQRELHCKKIPGSAAPRRSVHCSANWKELPMSDNTMKLTTQTGQTAELDPFDLDIRVIESGDAAATLINLTDDGCGSTCASPCATNVA